MKQLLLLAAFAVAAQPAMALSDIEYMKKCARQVRLERAQWFFNETGITTSPSSSAASDYANRMEAMGMQTKTPIPYRDCSPSSRPR